MSTTFHLAILEREVRRIKQRHLDVINEILAKYFRNKPPVALPIPWILFDANNPEHFDYLVSVFTVGCYLSTPLHLSRLEKVYIQADNVSLTRRAVALTRQVAAINMNIFASYTQCHQKERNQPFTAIMQRILQGVSSSVERGPVSVMPKGICYALTLRGSNYFLGHILVSDNHYLTEKDIKVAVMTKESVSHSPRVTAVVLCTIKHVQDCRRFYRLFTILDTRGQSEYDFTILLNRVSRSLTDTKSILVPDRHIRYVITPAP